MNRRARFGNGSGAGQSAHAGKPAEVWVKKEAGGRPAGSGLEYGGGGVMSLSRTHGGVCSPACNVAARGQTTSPPPMPSHCQTRIIEGQTTEGMRNAHATRKRDWVGAVSQEPVPVVGVLIPSR
jgi:hypothetical protein